jgi:hypothetical protein
MRDSPSSRPKTTTLPPHARPESRRWDRGRLAAKGPATHNCARCRVLTARLGRMTRRRLIRPASDTSGRRRSVGATDPASVTTSGGDSLNRAGPPVLPSGRPDHELVTGDGHPCVPSPERGARAPAFLIDSAPLVAGVNVVRPRLRLRALHVDPCSLTGARLQAGTPRGGRSGPWPDNRVPFGNAS